MIIVARVIAGLHVWRDRCLLPLLQVHGKEELRCVVAEMKRLKEEHHRNHPAAAEEARLKELAKKDAAENGTPAEKAMHELEKKEKVKQPSAPQPPLLVPRGRHPWRLTSPQVRAIFEVFDADASGAMDAAELTELLRELCLPCEEDDVEEMMEEMDDDGSGEIDFDEFYSW